MTHPVGGRQGCESRTETTRRTHSMKLTELHITLCRLRIISFTRVQTNLSDLKQEGDPEGAEDFLVEVSDRD